GSVGTLFQTTGGGCIDGGKLGTQLSLAAVDMCFIFDCQNGFLGGTFNPCGDPNNPLDNIFVDCPVPVAPVQ
ncbi:MAG: hypothetical protein GTN78_14685, partial [Gemmatimonadales bacterium]|nr:hypothetical protein [Gemmatimonadales bacterium]